MKACHGFMRRQSAQHLNAFRRKPDLFMRFAQRSGNHIRIAFVLLAARKRDLTRVMFNAAERLVSSRLSP